MLKILVLADLHTGGDYINDFVYHLKDKCEVVCSFDEFWQHKIDFDLVHIHWPEYIFGWREPTGIELVCFENALKYWKKKSRIVCTRHNFYPHLGNTILYQELYDLVYKYSDGVFHLGSYSRKEYLEKYNLSDFIHTQSQFVVLHPFFSCYPDKVMKEEARKHFNIPLDSYVVAIMGNIRDEREKKLILKTYRYFKKRKYIFLVSRWKEEKRPSLRKAPLNLMSWVVRNRLLKYSKNLILNNHYCEKEFVQYFLNSADLVFLPRINSLNSGVIPLAFNFKKTVIGPACGNMMEMLVQSGNPMFCANNFATVVDAFNKVKGKEESQGLRNYEYSMKNLDPKIIYSKIADDYAEIIHKT